MHNLSKDNSNNGSFKSIKRTTRIPRTKNETSSFQELTTGVMADAVELLQCVL